MKQTTEGILLRIYIGDADRKDGRPLYEMILKAAMENHLAGATVLRGVMSYGKSSRMHSSKLLELSSNMPVLIEIIDDKDRIEAFLPIVQEMVTSGLITTESVDVIHCRHE